MSILQLLIHLRSSVTAGGRQQDVVTRTEQMAAGAGSASGGPPSTFAAAVSKEAWDPDSADSVPPGPDAVRRIHGDLRALHRDPVPGATVCVTDRDLTHMQALIVGPEDTPYAGALFTFVLRLPPSYPHDPPRVKLLTTGGGTVRFNPNLYKNGKVRGRGRAVRVITTRRPLPFLACCCRAQVCLSILGTWAGPGWSPAQTLSSLLFSILSLLSPNPASNEPGFERISAEQSEAFNDVIVHETLRVAVCDVVRTRADLLPEMREQVETVFRALLPDYLRRCADPRYVRLEGSKFRDPFGWNEGTFRFRAIADSLRALAADVGVDPEEMDAHPAPDDEEEEGDEQEDDEEGDA
jgi:ubiquitin-conjugating enzyme E2 Z